MDSLDFGVQSRANGLNTAYVSKPQGLRPVVDNVKLSQSRKAFDNDYCKTVQAYFAPNFIKSGEKPCSVTEYTAKLKAAGLQEGKDYEIIGRESDLSFGLDICLKDSFGRTKKVTSWENGLEADNFMGYDKYSYSGFDPSYKKISSYSRDNTLFYISETTAAIPQKDLTANEIDFSTKPKAYIEALKSRGISYEIKKSASKDNPQTFFVEILEPNFDSKRLTRWHIKEGKLASIIQDTIGEDENIQKRVVLKQDGISEVIHYFQ